MIAPVEKSPNISAFPRRKRRPARAPVAASSSWLVIRTNPGILRGQILS